MARTGAILEFELLDSDLTSRGLAMGEIVGQGFEALPNFDERPCRTSPELRCEAADA